jgi:hypothetical protein
VRILGIPVRVCNRIRNSTNKLKLTGTNKHVHKTEINLESSSAVWKSLPGTNPARDSCDVSLLARGWGFLDLQAAGFAADNQYLLYVRNTLSRPTNPAPPYPSLPYPIRLWFTHYGATSQQTLHKTDRKTKSADHIMRVCNGKDTGTTSSCQQTTSHLYSRTNLKLKTVSLSSAPQFKGRYSLYCTVCA